MSGDDESSELGEQIGTSTSGRCLRSGRKLGLLHVSGLALAGLLGSACALLPDAAADPARGAGVAVALDVRGAAVSLAGDIAARPRPACRRALATVGPAAVTTTFVWTRKAPGVRAEVLRESHEWRRDAAGDIRSSRDLQLTLPDGRVTHRRREERLVDGVGYAAIDGRFSHGDRIEGLASRVERAAFEGVDSLLALVAVDASGALVPARSEGLCGPVPATTLPPPQSAGLSRTERGRRGWLRFAERDTRLVVTFDERVHSADDEVDAPEVLWPVDPERTWSTVQAFVAEGLADGWLSPPRLVDPETRAAGDEGSDATAEDPEAAPEGLGSGVGADPDSGTEAPERRQP